MSDNEMPIEFYEFLQGKLDYFDRMEANLAKDFAWKAWQHCETKALEQSAIQQAKIDSLSSDYQDMRIDNDLLKHNNKVLHSDWSELQKTAIAQQVEIERLRQPVSDEQIELLLVALDDYIIRDEQEARERINAILERK